MRSYFKAGPVESSAAALSMHVGGKGYSPNPLDAGGSLLEREVHLER
jgi:hypothetical protein